MSAPQARALFANVVQPDLFDRDFDVHYLPEGEEPMSLPEHVKLEFAIIPTDDPELHKTQLQVRVLDKLTGRLVRDVRFDADIDIIPK